jgi:hypothetical protein
MQVPGEEQRVGDRVSRGVEVMKEVKVGSIKLIKILGAEIQAHIITGVKEMQWQLHPPKHSKGKDRVVNVNSAQEVLE